MKLEGKAMTIIPGPWVGILIKVELTREEALDQVTPKMGSGQSFGAQGPSQHDSLSLQTASAAPKTSLGLLVALSTEKVMDP